jgi:hypothetical protein
MQERLDWICASECGRLLSLLRVLLYFLLNPPPILPDRLDGSIQHRSESGGIHIDARTGGDIPLSIGVGVAPREVEVAGPLDRREGEA